MLTQYVLTSTLILLLFNLKLPYTGIPVLGNCAQKCAFQRRIVGVPTRYWCRKTPIFGQHPDVHILCKTQHTFNWKYVGEKCTQKCNYMLEVHFFDRTLRVPTRYWCALVKQGPTGIPISKRKYKRIVRSTLTTVMLWSPRHVANIQHLYKPAWFVFNRASRRVVNIRVCPPAKWIHCRMTHLWLHTDNQWVYITTTRC